MNEVGLAQNSANEMVGQVVQMLQQGATPDELIAMGVPKEVIMMAIEMLQQGSQPQVPVEQAGMRGMSTPNTLQGM